jgi:uncharacterized protein (UPF0332 family)
MFGLHFVKSKRIDPSFGKLYGRVFNLRQSGDYEDWETIEEDDLGPLLEPAKQFIDTIDNMLSSDGLRKDGN